MSEIDIYTVESAHKYCHPETCNHDADWKLMKNGIVYDFYDDHEQAIKDCDELNARQRPTKTEWVDGLPPVGCECEGMINYGSSTKWRRCEVLKYRNGQAAVLVDDPGFLAWCEEFRPIRTPEQRMREKLKELVSFAVLDCRQAESHKLMDAITDAILSKYNLTEK